MGVFIIIRLNDIDWGWLLKKRKQKYMFFMKMRFIKIVKYFFFKKYINCFYYVYIFIGKNNNLQLKYNFEYFI